MILQVAPKKLAFSTLAGLYINPDKGKVTYSATKKHTPPQPDQNVAEHVRGEAFAVLLWEICSADPFQCYAYHSHWLCPCFMHVLRHYWLPFSRHTVSQAFSPSKLNVHFVDYTGWAVPLNVASWPPYLFDGSVLQALLAPCARFVVFASLQITLFETTDNFLALFQCFCESSWCASWF